jgi:hypothetical protein
MYHGVCECGIQNPRHGFGEVALAFCPRDEDDECAGLEHLKLIKPLLIGCTAVTGTALKGQSFCAVCRNDFYYISFNSLLVVIVNGSKLFWEV